MSFHSNPNNSPTSNSSFIQQTSSGSVSLQSLQSSIIASLGSQSLPTPSVPFLTSILSSQRTPQTHTQTPLPALIATAKHRLLSADFTSIPHVLSDTTEALPANVGDPSVQGRRLSGNIPVQVIDIEDIGRGKWEQVEEIEDRERGERMRGRVVVRIEEEEDNDTSVEGGRQSGTGASGMTRAKATTYKLTLEDVKGQRVFALELKPVPKIDMSMPIGTKLMLRGAVLARGVVLLEPGTVIVLGGKIETLHRAWTEGKKKALMDGLEMDDP